VRATRWLTIKARAGRVLLASLVVFVVVSVFWYRRMTVEDQSQAPAGIPANDTKADMVSRDFRHVETRMDRTIWVLEAARAEVTDDRASLYAVKVTWFGEPGDVTVSITSAEGSVDFKKRTAELRGAVRLERADGAVLNTEKLSWDEKSKVLQAPLPVVITTPTATIKGEGLEADLATGKIVLRGRVQGEIRGSSLSASRPY
jgi:LPS export ABC transporter protein LptC